MARVVVRVQGADTDDSIIECGRRLAVEVSSFLHTKVERQRKRLRHLSFVAHSMGCANHPTRGFAYVVSAHHGEALPAVAMFPNTTWHRRGIMVRVALCHPCMSRYRRNLQSFVSLAVPHMGTQMATSSLFSTGSWPHVPPCFRARGLPVSFAALAPMRPTPQACLLCESGASPRPWHSFR